MIVAAAVCPHPLLMFRELGGARRPGGRCRAPRRSRRCAPSPPPPTRSSWCPARDVHFSSPAGRLRARPAGHPRGRRLLADAGEIPPGDDVVVDAGASAGGGGRPRCARWQERPGRTALLVMGDLSARRATEGGPGTYDGRAADFDSAVERALGTGDPAALGALDAGLADDLLVAGRAALQVLSGLAGADVGGGDLRAGAVRRGLRRGPVDLVISTARTAVRGGGPSWRRGGGWRLRADPRGPRTARPDPRRHAGAPRRRHVPVSVRRARGRLVAGLPAGGQVIPPAAGRSCTGCTRTTAPRSATGWGSTGSWPPRSTAAGRASRSRRSTAGRRTTTRARTARTPARWCSTSCSRCSPTVACAPTGSA